MIRRSFRIGLLLGLLGGVAFALTKLLGNQDRGAPALADRTPEPWPRLTTDPTTTAPPIARAVPDPITAPVASDLPVMPDPVAPAPTAPVVEAAMVEPPMGDPILDAADAAPAAAEAPAKKAPAKKAGTKKAATKKAATKKAAAKKAAPAKAWVEPTGNACPTSHPVKAKLVSKIFHLPGGFNYDRTNPDRCYLDAEKAEADGLRPSKR